MFVKRK